MRADHTSSMIQVEDGSYIGTNKDDTQLSESRISDTWISEDIDQNNQNNNDEIDNKDTNETNNNLDKNNGVSTHENDLNTININKNILTTLNNNVSTHENGLNTDKEILSKTATIISNTQYMKNTKKNRYLNEYFYTYTCIYKYIYVHIHKHVYIYMYT
jgi:hypothetical protein